MQSRSLPYVMALLAAAAVLAVVWVVDRLEQARFHEANRTSVIHRLSAIRARLEGALNAHLFLTRGLVGRVSTHPSIDEQEFQALAKEVLTDQSAIRSIELAKNTVATHLYLREGNEKARGPRLLDLPNQQLAFQRALDTRQTVVAGPVDLAQGRAAFVSRIPIYLTPPGGPPAGGPYWGLATILIDKDTLLKEAGLFDDSEGVQYALRGKDGLGAQGEVFFGDTALFELNPVALDVFIPNGSWQLAAIPVGGWAAVSPSFSLFRIGGALLAIIAAGLAFFVTLTRIRLREREQALRGSEKRYRILYEDNPAMYFTVDQEGTVLSVNWFGAAQLGYTVDELLGQSVLNIFHPDDRDAVLQQLNGCFENAEQLFRWEFRKVRKDGGVIWVREAARAIRAMDGKTLALIVCEDITELKRAEESLRQSHDELELRVEERTGLLRDSEAALRDSQKDLQDLAGKLLKAQEEERRRLAREL
ncbi:MAG: PAS domain S-box protein, partial [candidate division NC10 bacterium]|nr:PAS domain S-box protein [candidate division NC10 bacterium]